ncbi:hypothetical protein [Methylobacterium sp. Leaf100]|uniref:hypothetical protein n=1 Tax=Methylobacterium sp. Leaf100 TaxID=1736252 RepID=UPI0012E20408|nr:hypothetical protein [Methylobacterium sp. Leaf100]
MIDEYLNPSARSTGGHIHTQFNNQEAAKRYSDYTSNMKKSGESIASSGWKKPDAPNAFGGSADAMTAATPVRQGNLVSPGKTGGANAGASGGGGGGSGAVINIQGQNLDAHSIANAVQRRWNENVSRGTHDIDSQSL